jgi:hypothetical protein
MQRISNDLSTLAALHPSQPLDFRIRAIKSSMRLQGSYNLALRRPAKSPESSRPYVPGDPVSMIDWKAFARNDQIIVRQKRDEASATIRICLDVSETMVWPTKKHMTVDTESLPTKKELAIRVAMNVAHIHLRLGDVVEVWLLSDGKSRQSNLRFRPRSSSEVLGFYEFAQGATFRDDVISSRFEKTDAGRTKVDICYWVGDGLGNGDYSAFLELGRRKLLIHTLSSLEVDVDWIQGDVCYFDEALGGKEYLGQVLSFNENYLNGLKEWTGRLRKRLNEDSGGYLLATDKTSIASYLEFLRFAAKK